MLKILCAALGLAATICLGSPAQAQLSEVKDALENALQDAMALGQQRFADRTGGDQDFIEATREQLRMTYDALRDLGRVNCNEGIPPETTQEARIEAISSCEIKKSETSHELLNRSAHMWLGFKPPYGGMELLLKIRSDIRRYIRLAEDDSALYPDAGAWPGPRPPYNPDSPGPPQVSGATSDAQAAQLRALQEQVSALSALARSAGLQVPSGNTPSLPQVQITPTDELRQLPRMDR